MGLSAHAAGELPSPRSRRGGLHRELRRALPAAHPLSVCAHASAPVAAGRTRARDQRRGVRRGAPATRALERAVESNRGGLQRIDHVGVRVAAYTRSRKGFETRLAPLGYSLIMEFGDVAGFGVPGRPDFWISAGAGSPVHVAIASVDHATVDAFYQAAIAAGGRDNGGPGLRPEYHPNYYGAFVLDPDGNNI